MVSATGGSVMRSAEFDVEVLEDIEQPGPVVAVLAYLGLANCW